MSAGSHPTGQVHARSLALLEAAGLQEELRRAGIEPWAWIVNQSIAAASTMSPLLQRRADNELVGASALMALTSPSRLAAAE